MALKKHRAQRGRSKVSSDPSGAVIRYSSGLFEKGGNPKGNKGEGKKLKEAGKKADRE